MRWNQFNLLILGLTCGAAVTLALVNRHIDLFGLYHPDPGRTRTIYRNEKMAKYLLSFRYMPEQFDGLLVGSSISDNWDTRAITGYAIYNASINGGNISEEKIIADNVYRRGSPRLLVMLIQPYLTETYGPKTAIMVKEQVWGTLGSQQLMTTYLYWQMVRMGRVRADWNSYGCFDFPPPRRDPAADRIELDPKPEFPIDERAVADYRSVLEEARSHGTRVVGVIPPISMEFWNARKVAIRAYKTRFAAMFRPDEPIIDFNDPEFEALRSDPSHFPDGVHLSKGTADQVVAVLNQRLAGLGQRASLGNNPLPQGGQND